MSIESRPAQVDASLRFPADPLNLMMGAPDWLGIDAPLAHLADWVAEQAGPQTSANFVLMARVDHLLARLAPRYPLALVTARGALEARHFLDQFELAPHFRAVASAQTAPHTKPYPHPVMWAARELGVPVENCLMVGDTAVDILAGRRAGAQTAGVLCGFGARHELERAGANAILDHTTHLDRLLVTSDPPSAPPPSASPSPKHIAP